MMKVFVEDSETVPETENTLFSLLQSGTPDCLIHLHNAGVNTVNYRCQVYNGSTWVDIGVSGSDTYNTLTANQVRSIKLVPSSPQIRVVGNASGGSVLKFAVFRYFTRSAGGPLPILSL
jgi:hypothetical protein